MPRLMQARITIALFLLVLGLLFAPRPASASPIGLTLTLDSTGPFFTVIEGKNLTLDFTLTNNSGEELEFSELDMTESPITVGEPFIDLANVSFMPQLTSLLTLSSGSSTNFAITFPATFATAPNFFPQDAFESLSVGFIYCPVSDPQCTSADELSSGVVGFFVTIENASATPEPPSLLLLGTGLLGLGPLIRRFALS